MIRSSEKQHDMNNGENSLKIETSP